MKTRNVLIAMLGVAIIAVLATLAFKGSAPWHISKTDHKTPENIVIEFKVSDDSSELVFTESDCTPKKKGCFKAKKGKTAMVKFVFNPGDVADGWKLSEFKVCKATSKASQDCNLNVWERLDFVVADDDTGSNMLIANNAGAFNLSRLLAAANEFYLFDLNTINKSFFYSIKACKGGCVSTDPLIDNKGRH